MGYHETGQSILSEIAKIERNISAQLETLHGMVIETQDIIAQSRDSILRADKMAAIALAPRLSRPSNLPPSL